MKLKTLIRSWLFVFSSLLLLSFSSAKPSTGDDILGKWTNEDKNRVIEFVKNGSTYEAVMRTADKTELVGKKFITGLTYDGKKYKGHLYVPRTGKSYSCTIKLNGNIITITASSGFVSQSKTWTRVK